VSNQAKVGIFSAITIAIFVFGFYFLKGVDLFERKNVYYAVYDRVDGLNKSNLVEINGYPVGRVGKMDRDPKTGKIVVQLVLDNGIRIPDSDSTVAYLVSTDFLGSKEVSLVFGESDEYMKEGDTISTEFRKDISEQIDPMIVDVKRMVPKIDSVITGVNLLFAPNNPNSVFYTLRQVNGAVEKVNGILESNQETLQLTLKNMQSITKNIESNNAAITAIINNSKNITDSLQQANLKEVVDNLNSTIVQLSTMVDGINDGDGTLGKVIKDDELYNHIDSTVSSLNSLLKDVKARPYRYIDISVFGGKKHDKRREQIDNDSGK